jgi:hypothetical protein
MEAGKGQGVKWMEGGESVTMSTKAGGWPAKKRDWTAN